MIDPMSQTATPRLVAVKPPLASVRARLIAVDRALAEFRRGDPVLVTGASGGAVLALSAETASDAALELFARLAAAPPGLAVTVHRARAIGIAWSGSDATVLLELPANTDAGTIRRICDPTLAPPPGRCRWRAARPRRRPPLSSWRARPGYCPRRWSHKPCLVPLPPWTG